MRIAVRLSESSGTIMPKGHDNKSTPERRCSAKCSGASPTRERTRPTHAHCAAACRHFATVAGGDPMKNACSVAGCDHPVRCKDLCQSHYRRMLRNGSPTEFRPMGRPRSDEGVTYNAVHFRLKYDRGPARDYPCADCGEPAQAWSYGHGDPDELIDEKGRPYSLDLSQYAPRCWPCHNPIDRRAKARRVA